jgi:molecular chaperone GrpE
VSDELRDEADEVIAAAQAVIEEEALAEEVEEDLDELGRALAERDEFREMAQRLQADFENYRKRSAAQAEQTADRRAGEVVVSLLPVLDTFDLAQGHLSEETESSADATALVQARAQLLDILAKLGLAVVPGKDEPFDPQVHDAVAHAEGDGETVVDEVLRAGYTWRGTVLRPAMVRVRG